MPAPANPTGTAGTQARRGLVLGAAAYVIWGSSALYWPLLRPSGVLEILSMRVVCSLFALGALIVLRHHVKRLRTLLRQPRKLALLGVASLLTAVNWGLFIYATTSGRVIDASMGYFINPIVMVVLGVLVFRERPRPLQWAAVGAGVVGVLVLGVGTGRPPWIALCLAASFGAYALIKKALGVGAVVSMTVETAILFLPALAYCLVLQVNGTATFGRVSVTHALLMIGANVVMLSPMLLFSAAANRIPLSVAGLLQYLEPVIQFLIGLLVFSEAMSGPRWGAFLMIWVALAILGYDGFRSAALRKQASKAGQAVAAGSPGSSSSRSTAVRSMNSNS